MWTGIVLYVGYVLVGPLAWTLYAIGMYQAQKRMNLVKPPRKPVPDPAPGVTILIPAKDEGERIRDCIGTAIAQHYSKFRVIAIDDRSSDNTGQVMDALAALHPQLSVLHIPHQPLPGGWTGKCHALYQGVKHVDPAFGQWMLFVDSDVMLQPDALAATLGVAIAKNYGLLSLLPAMESHSFWEALVVPLAGAAVASLFTAPLNNTNTMPPPPSPTVSSC